MSNINFFKASRPYIYYRGFLSRIADFTGIRSTQIEKRRIFSQECLFFQHGNERIISLFHLGFGSLCFCDTCTVLSRRWPGTYPLCSLHSRTARPVSRSAHQLSWGAQRPGLWMLFLLCPGERRLLRRLYGPLRHRPSMLSQAWGPETPPLADQRTWGLHWSRWGRRCDFISFSYPKYS